MSRIASPYQVADILAAAEASDHYLEKCAASPMNAAARKWYTYDYNYVGEDAYRFLQNTAREIPLFNDPKTKPQVVVLDPTADGGMPHTRPQRLICIPSKLIPTKPSAAFTETLLHEAVHVHQRIYPTLWTYAMAQAGWEPVDPRKIPEPLLGRVRINPDTLVAPQFWSWNSHHIPLPLFSTQVAPHLSDARIEWLDTRTGALFKMPPPTFPAGGEGGTELEHPFELYAYRFSKAGLKSHEEIVAALQRSA